MRIAIVAPSPNPFVVGGAEGLWWGMLAWLNREGGHQADLIKLPVRESSLRDLVAGYEAFSRLDLAHFDLVISTKYPAWMVSHPRHVVFLQHRCRGFYDWYPEAQAGGTEYRGHDREVRALLDFMTGRRGDRAALPEFFERFRRLIDGPSADAMAQPYPGPVSRAIVRFLDGIGLAPSGIRRYFAIAEAVKRRADYFPPGVQVEVVHHPTDKTGFHDAGEDYFFTASRFYPSKRIDLLIEAYRATDIPLPFRLAGTGQEEGRLREAAGNDPRFEFLGFVRDEELVAQYARALAVPFIPADEDFGFITLEAMLAGKPVITADDAGGPLELVRDGVTGIVVRPEVAALAGAFQRVYKERDWARMLGRNAKARAESITWQGLFDRLLSPAAEAAPSRPRRAPRTRITVMNAYGVHPPDNGGRYKLSAMARALATQVDVDLVTLGLHAEGDAVLYPVEGVRELRVARTAAHAAADHARHGEAGTPVYDLTSLEHIELTPNYVTTLEASLAGSRLAVVSHPYMLAAMRATGYAGPFVHESHNFELGLKRRMLSPSPVRDVLLARVRDAEGYCCREARLVYAVSAEDVRDLRAEYGGRAEDFIVIPNGTDTRTIPFSDTAARRAVRRRLSLGDRPIALFLASGHRPNLDAAEHLFLLAEKMPDVAFAFVGNAAYAYAGREFPENIWMVGVVSEEERNVWMQVASVALNPMLYGGGTNLKLLDYFAAGTPVVSTPIGTRGSGALAGRHLVEAEMDALEGAIRFVLEDEARAATMAREARALVEAEFDWERLAARLLAAFRERGLL